MSGESTKNRHTSGNIFALELINNYTLRKVKFKGICWKQVHFLYKNVLNLYISYKLDIWSKDFSPDFTLGNHLFGAIKLIKINDPDKYAYSTCGVGFDARSQCLWLDGSLGKNVVSFGADMSSPVHFDNKNKYFWWSLNRRFRWH